MSRAKKSVSKHERAPLRSCLFSIRSTAERLGVSVFTVRRLVQTKALKSVRISRRVMIPDVEISRAIKHGCGQ